MPLEKDIDLTKTGFFEHLTIFKELIGDEDIFKRFAFLSDFQIAVAPSFFGSSSFHVDLSTSSIRAARR